MEDIKKRMEREEIQKRLKKELDKNRYEHTLGVMYTAGSLAMAYGYDYEKAMIAGLLHDCAKCLPTEKKISLCEKNDILISNVSMADPFHTVHKIDRLTGSLGLHCLFSRLNNAAYHIRFLPYTDSDPKRQSVL